MMIRHPQRLAAEVAIAATAEVGEGPLWHAASGRLLWVDITRGTLHRSDPGSGADAETATGTLLGAVAPRDDGDGLAAAVADGFALLSDAGEVTVVDPVSGGADERMNDAKCDPAGRLWGGSTAMTPTAGGGAL
ncbi:MAG TPA: SMP-30/gluconolactonase/LRE family protein, partial [Conexibacter sp.]|nr:SMP-30/gluconolactonase/LRE family protein [Conexibacter sp.]